MGRSQRAKRGRIHSMADKMLEIRRCKRDLYFYGSTIAPSLPSATSKKFERFSILVGGLWSRETDLQLQASSQICDLFSSEKNPPIDVIIRSGVVPRFVQFLRKDDLPALQCEAAWALANIASESSIGTQEVINKKALPKLCKLLSSRNPAVREQAVFALGILAGHSPTCRDSILGLGALVPLLQQFKAECRDSMLINAAWTLLNFCGGVPRPSFNQVRPAFETLKHLLDREDEEVLVDSCLALSYLLDGKWYEVEEVIQAGVCPRLVELLNHHSSEPVIRAALQAIGNIIISGNATQIQVILDHGALGYMLGLLNGSHCDYRIKKATCYIISNIVAENKDRIQAVIDAQMIDPLLQLLQAAEFDVRARAARALSHIASFGTREQIQPLVTVSCIKGLYDLLLSPGMPFVYSVLDGLYKIIRKEGLSLEDKLIKDIMDMKKIRHFTGHISMDVAELASFFVTHRTWKESLAHAESLRLWKLKKGIV